MSSSGHPSQPRRAWFFLPLGANLNLSAFCNPWNIRHTKRRCIRVHTKKSLFVRPTPSPGTVFVNDRVSVQTEEKQRVVLVQGVVFSHYSIDDRSAEAYAMVQLFETGYARQNDIS